VAVRVHPSSGIGAARVRHCAAHHHGYCVQPAEANNCEPGHQLRHPDADQRADGNDGGHVSHQRVGLGDRRGDDVHGPPVCDGRDTTHALPHAVWHSLGVWWVFSVLHAFANAYLLWYAIGDAQQLRYDHRLSHGERVPHRLSDGEHVPHGRSA